MKKVLLLLKSNNLEKWISEKVFNCTNVMLVGNDFWEEFDLTILGYIQAKQT